MRSYINTDNSMHVRAIKWKGYLKRRVQDQSTTDSAEQHSTVYSGNLRVHLTVLGYSSFKIYFFLIQGRIQDFLNTPTP